MYPSSSIQRWLNPDPILFWAWVLPLLYWSYLTLTTNFALVFDSESYYHIAQQFYTGQWRSYFIEGPNREPIYPLVIAFSFCLGKWFGISYIYFLRILSFALLAATMLIIQRLLHTLGANRWIKAATLLYIGFSPIMINCALCMYSEIASFPWLVAAVAFSLGFLRDLQDHHNRPSWAGIGLGLCLIGYTFVKGMGEFLTPLFLAWLLGLAWQRSGVRLNLFLQRSFLKILGLLLAFYLPLIAVKTGNYIYDGSFKLTCRGEIALYGATTERDRNPFNLQSSLIHLSTAPVSYPICRNFYTAAQCDTWYLSSDNALEEYNKKLDSQHLSDAQKVTAVHHEILRQFFSHPLKQTVFWVEESLKMFFWESIQGPFVVYPTWLADLFNHDTWAMVIALGGGLLCLVGFFTALTLLKNDLIAITVMLTALLVLLFGFASILPRYAVTAAPLMILLNAACITVLLQACQRTWSTANAAQKREP